MPFTYDLRPFTRDSISVLTANQSGVYGIFKGTSCVYVGSGDIKERLLAHFDEDNACITRNAPDQWTAIVLQGDPKAREAELIREYAPPCNQRMPA